MSRGVSALRAAQELSAVAAAYLLAGGFPAQVLCVGNDRVCDVGMGACCSAARLPSPRLMPALSLSTVPQDWRHAPHRAGRCSLFPRAFQSSLLTAGQSSSVRMQMPSACVLHEHYTTPPENWGFLGRLHPRRMELKSSLPGSASVTPCPVSAVTFQSLGRLMVHLPCSRRCSGVQVDGGKHVQKFLSLHSSQSSATRNLVAVREMQIFLIVVLSVLDI